METKYPYHKRRIIYVLLIGGVGGGGVGVGVGVGVGGGGGG